MTTDPEKAKAPENDVRAKTLATLAAEEMPIEAFPDELHRRGEEKAETTVRYHVNVLKDAGMVEMYSSKSRRGDAKVLQVEHAGRLVRSPGA